MLLKNEVEMNTIKSLVCLVMFALSRSVSCSSATDSYMHDYNLLIHDNRKPIIYCDNDQFSKTHDVAFKPITITLEEANGNQVTKDYRTIRDVQMDLYKYWKSIDGYSYNNYDVNNFNKLFSIIDDFKEYVLYITYDRTVCFKNADERVKEKVEEDNALTAAVEDLGL